MLLPTIVLKVSFSLFMITNLKKLFYIIVSVLLFQVKSFGAPDAGSLLKDQQDLQKLNEIIIKSDQDLQNIINVIIVATRPILRSTIKSLVQRPIQVQEKGKKNISVRIVATRK